MVWGGSWVISNIISCAFCTLITVLSAAFLKIPGVIYTIHALCVHPVMARLPQVSLHCVDGMSNKHGHGKVARLTTRSTLTALQVANNVTVENGPRSLVTLARIALTIREFNFLSNVHIFVEYYVFIYFSHYFVLQQTLVDIVLLTCFYSRPQEKCFGKRQNFPVNTHHLYSCKGFQIGCGTFCTTQLYLALIWYSDI